MQTHVAQYRLGEEIGKGTFGKVRLGYDIFTGNKVAIKIVEYNKIKTISEKKLLEREKIIMGLLDHPNIIKLMKLVDDFKNGYCYMIMEYAGGGELFDYVISRGRLKEREARKFIRQIISAMEYCHAHLIVHRDLKPENLLLDESSNIKITDFGLSNVILPGKKFNTFCGSLHYACPEILLGEKYMGPGADIWAIGVILYCLVTGYQPWNATTSEKMLDHIFTDGIQIPVWITSECADLIAKMLRLRENDRIKLPEIRGHPWIIKGYKKPPPSYLPKCDRVSKINERVMSELVQIGFEDDEMTRISILNGEHSQVVATYHNLLRRCEGRFGCGWFDRNIASTCRNESLNPSGLIEMNLDRMTIDPASNSRIDKLRNLFDPLPEGFIGVESDECILSKKTPKCHDGDESRMMMDKLHSKSSVNDMDIPLGEKTRSLNDYIRNEYKNGSKGCSENKDPSGSDGSDRSHSKKTRLKEKIESIFNMGGSKMNLKSNLKSAIKESIKCDDSKSSLKSIKCDDSKSSLKSVKFNDEAMNHHHCPKKDGGSGGDSREFQKIHNGNFKEFNGNGKNPKSFSILELFKNNFISSMIQDGAEK